MKERNMPGAHLPEELENRPETKEARLPVSREEIQNRDSAAGVPETETVRTVQTEPEESAPEPARQDPPVIIPATPPETYAGGAKPGKKPWLLYLLLGVTMLVLLGAMYLRARENKPGGATRATTAPATTAPATTIPGADIPIYVTIETPDGVYEGYTLDGVYQGYGIFTWSDGSRYEGYWVSGRMQGHGMFTWAEGIVYEGDWYQGERHGYGVLNWPSGTVFEGNWEHDKRQGWGVVSWLDGDFYEGSWANDMRNGHGIYYWADGTVYEGNWENDERNGQGTMTHANGDVESGQWKNGEFIG